MAENVVETILVKLGLDASSFSGDADKAIKTNDKLNKSVENTDKIVSTVGKTLGRFFGGIASATGLAKLIDEVQKLNDELYFLERNLGMSANTIKSWQGAASAMGGSADGMTSSMKSLNKSMNDFVVKGDTSILQFTNALGVSIVGTNGKLRETDQVMLDLADSFSKMDREQAFGLASDMGIDEGTFNTLVQGRKEMEKMIEYQKTIYKSSEKELQVSRDLARNRALLGTHWESMKLMIGNMLMPLFLKLSEVLLGMFEYLQAHQREVKAFFTGLAFVIGAILTPILIKATVAALAFIAPFAPFILVVTALGAAFGALYDDYKTWAEGGNSLFDWGAFRKYIDDSTISTDNLKNAFKNLTKEVLSGAIPTLKGYADIVRMLAEGNFKGAGALATEMLGNLGRNIGDVVDDVTGNERGGFIDSVSRFLFPDRATTISGTGEGAVSAKQSYSSKQFTADKAKSIARVAKNIGVDPNDLAAVISFETGGTFDPNIKNPKSSATGLIQFMKGSGGTKGKYYGMSREEFGSLSFDEQMKYVEKYFKDRGFKQGRNYTTGDVYGAVTGYGYKKGTEAYELNKVWDSNKNGVVEKGEMVQNPKFRAHQRDYFGNGVGGNAAQIQQTIRQGTSQIPANAQSSNISNRNDVKIGDINVYTTASNVKGTTTDAMTAVNNQLFQFGVSMT